MSFFGGRETTYYYLAVKRDDGFNALARQAVRKVSQLEGLPRCINLVHFPELLGAAKRKTRSRKLLRRHSVDASSAQVRAVVPSLVNDVDHTSTHVNIVFRHGPGTQSLMGERSSEIWGERLAVF